MFTLAETQARIRDAVITGEMTDSAAVLDDRNEKRIAIHRRNYQSSLVEALLGKFPAVVWLAGAPFVAEVAKCFIDQFPPQKPCIAEYGENFPEYLSTRPGAERMPYLKTFAELEWHIGHMAIAIPEPHAVRYLRSSWPVDELMKLYLTDSAPDRLEFAPCDVFLEIRGARGEFQFDRLPKAEFY